MKKISLLLLLVPTLLFGQGWYYSHVETGAGPLIRTDNFNRASLGSNWTALWNSHSISASTVLVGNTGGDENASYWNADTPGNDQYSELQKVDDFDGGGPTVRVQTGSQSFYLLYDPISPSAVLMLFETSSGSFTQLGANFSATTDGNDVLKLSITGTTLTVYVNDISQGTRTSATWSSGRWGIHTFDTAHKQDNWEGGEN